MGDADRLAGTVTIHEIELEIVEAVQVCREDEVFAAGMEKGSPRHGAEAGELFLTGAVDVHGEHLGRHAFAVEAAPADLLAVGAEKRAAIVAISLCQPLHAGPVGVHEIQLHGKFLVELEEFRVLFRKAGLVGLAVRGKDDVLPIRRVGALGVVALCLGQIRVGLGGRVVFDDVEGLVVVPAVFPGLARLAEFDLVLLLLPGGGIVLSGGVEDLFAIGMDPGAGRFAVAGRDPLGVAGLQIQPVDLVEGIALLALALEDHLAPIGREIALAGAFALERELPDVREQRRFAGGIGGFRRGGCVGRSGGFLRFLGDEDEREAAGGAEGEHEGEFLHGR